MDILWRKYIYVEYPLDFENHKFSDHVFKFNKILYGLKQASRAWYDRLSKFLLKIHFKRENIDTTLFIKNKSNKLLIIHIYVDDIIFDTTNESLCEEFTKLI